KVDELGRPVPWHLVGHLQTNKARDAVDLFDVIHSLDRLDLARELDKRAHARGRPVSALVEVNVGGEASKGGVAPDELGRLPAAADGAGGTMTIQGRTVGFVGAGNMGEALIKGLVVANVVPAKSIYSADVRGERLTELAKQFGIQAAADNSDLVSRCDVVILAVKPQIMEPVLREIAPAVTRQKLLISIAAGVSPAKTRAMLTRVARLIRVMPNAPALVLEGVTAIAKGQHLEPG